VLEWEYLAHPRAADLRVFVVESNGHLVASTTRLPATLVLDGQPHPAYFNAESMVHPDHRRKGLMRALYLHARANLPGSPFLFSKGSSIAIGPLLRTIGYRPIRPDTYLVCHPSVPRWVLSNLSLYPEPPEPDPRPPEGFGDFEPLRAFGPELDPWLARVTAAPAAVFKRDAAYMRWRYADIPHRRYTSFARVVDGEITSLVVLAMRGDRGNIVDLLWDPASPGEPDRAVAMAREWLASAGASRILCFATHLTLRQVLRSHGFLDRGHTPRFSVFVPASKADAFRAATHFHVLDGDGDTEFS
jgi:hypothetical protein